MVICRTILEEVRQSLLPEIDATLDDVERVLAIVQTMEPAGVGARSLGEYTLNEVQEGSSADLRHFLAAASVEEKSTLTGAGERGGGGRHACSHTFADALGQPAGQGRAEGVAVVRRDGRRLLPRTAARPARPRRPAGQHSLLEEPHRGDGRRQHLRRGPDLRAIGLRQVVAGEGRAAAAGWRSR